MELDFQKIIFDALKVKLCEKGMNGDKASDKAYELVELYDKYGLQPLIGLQFTLDLLKLVGVLK